MQMNIKDGLWCQVNGQIAAEEKYYKNQWQLKALPLQVFTMVSYALPHSQSSEKLMK